MLIKKCSCVCPVCRISTVVVDKAMRSRGVGKTLMAECHQWAKTNGAVEIRLEVMEFNDQAQVFYRELGFHTQSRIMAQAIG